MTARQSPELERNETVSVNIDTVLEAADDTMTMLVRSMLLDQGVSLGIQPDDVLTMRFSLGGIGAGLRISGTLMNRLWYHMVMDHELVESL